MGQKMKAVSQIVDEIVFILEESKQGVNKSFGKKSMTTFLHIVNRVL